MSYQSKSRMNMQANFVSSDTYNITQTEAQFKLTPQNVLQQPQTNLQTIGYIVEGRESENLAPHLLGSNTQQHSLQRTTDEVASKNLGSITTSMAALSTK